MFGTKLKLTTRMKLGRNKIKDRAFPLKQFVCYCLK